MRGTRQLFRRNNRKDCGKDEDTNKRRLICRLGIFRAGKRGVYLRGGRYLALAVPHAHVRTLHPSLNLRGCCRSLASNSPRSASGRQRSPFRLEEPCIRDTQRRHPARRRRRRRDCSRRRRFGRLWCPVLPEVVAGHPICLLRLVVRENLLEALQFPFYCLHLVVDPCRGRFKAGDGPNAQDIQR